jgi:hypothetical protein
MRTIIGWCLGCRFLKGPGPCKRGDDRSGRGCENLAGRRLQAQAADPPGLDVRGETHEYTTLVVDVGLG